MNKKDPISSIGKRGKGFVLPDGYSWNAKLVNGKKEGTITVRDEYGCLSHVLQFKNDKLNGICAFYDLGSLIAKRRFVNDVQEGWGCEFELGEEVRCYLYVNGIMKTELKKCDNMKGYWKGIDISSNQLVSICKYNDDYIPVDKGYLFDDKHIRKVVLFENGKEKSVLKSFEGNEMIEYDTSGNKVYKGDYVNDLSKDYEREGKGMEFVGGILVYAGEWKNGKRDGKGKSLKNGVAEYEGGWKEGLPNGIGLLKRDGKMYRGNWVIGKLEINECEWFDYEIGRVVSEKTIETVKMMIENENQLRELLKNDDKKRSVNELVIGEGCGNEMSDDLELYGFENLERFVVKKNSLKNLNSLKVFNNRELKSIEIYDGENTNSNVWEAPFENVKSVMIESMIIMKC